jgi:hypothetical protein
MAFQALSWWDCPYCAVPLFYASHEQLTPLVAAHFQRCAAIHFQLAVFYLRTATNHRKDNDERPNKADEI